MNIVFYVSAAVAVLATIMVITQLNAVHALLYLVLSLLAIAIIFYTLGAPFMAALEVIIYAGAIMVLFIFVIMMLNLGPQSVAQERAWLDSPAWIAPGILALVLIAEIIYVILNTGGPTFTGGLVEPKQVSIALFGPYLMGVELASIELLVGIMGAYHLGRRTEPGTPREGGLP